MKDEFRFSPIAPDQTATLSQLARHLDVELEKCNGEMVTSRTLKRTLEFLKSSIGIDIASSDEPVSMPVLRTVRLLFLTDLRSERNVFNLLAPPDGTRDATMEFATVTTIPRDSDAMALVDNLCESLAMEIDQSKLSMQARLLSQREKHSIAESLLLLVERTNDEVSQIFRDAFGSDEKLLVDCFTAMADLLDGFRVKMIEECTPPANEAMYVYLQTLPFRHFVQHYPTHLKATRVLGDIGRIQDEAEQFCTAAAGGAQHRHGPASLAFSLRTHHYLLQEHPDDLCELIVKATGIPTTVRQLQSHCNRVRALLTSYAYRSFDCTDPDAKVLSVFDVVAAFCSFRYQQVKGAEYKPYWFGQADQGKNPQRLFDKGLRDERPYQHQGVMQIYLNRFYEYQATFTDTLGSYRSWMGYQVSVLRAYQSVLDLKDICALTTGLNALSFHCANLAKDLVIDRYRTNR